jgi:hypothetical protein
MTQSPISGGVAAVIVLLAFAWSPRGYELSGQSLIVKRLAGNRTVPLEGLREVRAVSSDDLRGSIRLWGSGGMFGYYGLFQTTKLGTCNWYVTDKSKLVVLITAAKTVLVSPDDRERFIEALRPLASNAPSLPVTAGSRPRIRAVVLASVALSVALVGLVLSYAPGPPEYALTAHALVIKDRFYPATINAADVDVANVRVVGVEGSSEWRPTLRTNGFATRHYRSGWFRVAGGKTVRMYRADGSRLVLLPPKGNGTPVLLEVKDPEAFVEDLRSRWR